MARLITVQDAIHKRQELEENLRKLIDLFFEETGLSVQEINLSMMEHYARIADRKHLDAKFIRVSCKVEL